MGAKENKMIVSCICITVHVCMPDTEPFLLAIILILKSPFQGEVQLTAQSCAHSSKVNLLSGNGYRIAKPWTQVYRVVLPMPFYYLNSDQKNTPFSTDVPWIEGHVVWGLELFSPALGIPGTGANQITNMLFWQCICLFLPIMTE